MGVKSCISVNWNGEKKTEIPSLTNVASSEKKEWIDKKGREICAE